MMSIDVDQMAGSTSRKRSRDEAAEEGNGDQGNEGAGSKKKRLVEPCPISLANRALAALDTIAAKLQNAEPEEKITTAVCDSQAVCWNWALYGGSEATAADPRVYLYEEGQKERTESPAVRPNDSNARKIRAVLDWRGMREDEESRLVLIVYAMRGDKGNFPHWEYRWTDASDPTQYITITKGIDEDLKAFNGDSVVKKTTRTPFKIALDSLSEKHVLALEDLAKNPVV